jgi:hypothetical protein
MPGPARRVPELRDQVSSRCFQLSLHDARHRRDPLCARDFASGVRPREWRLLADIVAKVFLGWRTKILRAADAFYARRREGPYCFIQNRSLASVVALKSDAAAEKSKDQLSRDFWGCSIFDFCNNIGAKRTLV